MFYAFGFLSSSFSLPDPAFRPTPLNESLEQTNLNPPLYQRHEMKFIKREILCSRVRSQIIVSEYLAPYRDKLTKRYLVWDPLIAHLKFDTMLWLLRGNDKDFCSFHGLSSKLRCESCLCMPVPCHRSPFRLLLIYFKNVNSESFVLTQQYLLVDDFLFSH